MMNYYDKESEKLVLKHRAPKFCLEYFNNDQKRCKSFYEKSQIEKQNGELFMCPYGFSCYKTSNKIYTTLIVQNHFDRNKVQGHLKDRREKLSDFTIFTTDLLTQALDSVSSVIYEFDICTSTLHDLKNASSYFIDMANEIKNSPSFRQFIQENEKIYSAVEGYSLFNYMLKYHDNRISFSESKIQSPCNVHKMLFKLEKLLRFKASKKDIKIQISGFSKTTFNLYDDVYLAYFILLENAIKYSLSYKTITISVNEDQDNACEVKILNETRSVCEGDLPYLTEMGYRSIHSKNKPGSGLGLNLVDRIFRNSNVKVMFDVTQVGSVHLFEVTTLLLKD